jgi:hypothetical protein
MFLLQHGLPGIFGHIHEFAANSVMPHFPVCTWKDRVCVWDRAHLVFGIGRKHFGSNDLCSLLLLLGIGFPFNESVIGSVWAAGTDNFADKPFPTWKLHLEELIFVTDCCYGSLVLFVFRD